MAKHRNDENNRQDGRGKRTKSKTTRNDEQIQTGIDYDKLEVDAAHLLNVYDIDLIYSWTPRQFKNLIKGAQLKTIDEYELAAAGAMFTAKASNSKKRLKLKDLYDAEKIRKNIENPQQKKENGISLERYRKAKASLKSFTPTMT